MSNPWKRQVIWQKVVEKETLHYAHLVENSEKQVGVQTEQPKNACSAKKEEPCKKADAMAEFRDRLPNLPIPSSSTGTLQHVYARNKRVNGEGESCAESRESGSRREYRHGMVNKFRSRNASGGFYGL